ncbi:alanine racemase [Virgibacillus soli]|uniref:Alanine racemase n=1 Tax=Paracerasibacillus soli TaxID=480284 RepID=A0ABU5CVQ6_9BACI|nr:alanine racemase [Virgibacillus soli]MDY0410452.1 alanine racemase [Virgibacillus soli]
MKRFRNTWVEINLDAIGYNIRQMKHKLPTHTEVIAVVKADAYGHGSIEVAKKALESGAKALAVALLEEAIELRRASITAPILVLGWVAPELAPIAATHEITLTVFQKDWVLLVQQERLPKPLHVHMKWDTGMGRIGIRTEQELHELLQILKVSKQLKLTGVFTHFATADEQDLSYFQEQLQQFNQFLNLFKKEWPEQIAIHIGNSAAAIRFPDEMYNYIRFGISMYGLYPSNVIKENEYDLALKPAFSLKSSLIHVKKVQKGTSISYGKTYTTTADEWIGTLPIGYGDGWARKLQGIHVLVNGKRMPIVGRICMDQTMILLDKCYPVGTNVTLIGKQKGEEIALDDVAQYMDTINYEVACMINKRVPREYVFSQVRTE